MRYKNKKQMSTILTFGTVIAILTLVIIIFQYNSTSLYHKIPKHFHFVWISSNLDRTTESDIDDKILKNVNSCLKLHPDWKITIWTDDKIRKEFTDLIALLIKVKTPAVISDILRIHILMRYGGIYLDTDMMCLQNLEPLLLNQFCTGFVGNEEAMVDNGIIRHITNAIIGSVPQQPVFMKAATEILTGALSDVSPDIKTGRVFLANIIKRYNRESNCIYVYRKKVFYPCAFIERDKCQSIYEDSKEDPEVYTFHWWNSSWLKEWDSVIHE